MMGQQQLLLLVAAIVVVGLATIYGIYNFTEANAHAQTNMLIHDGANVSTGVEAVEANPKGEPLDTDAAVDQKSEDPKLVAEPSR